MPNNDKETDSIAQEADRIIAEAKQGCKDRGEIEPGIRRGKMHIWLEGSDICACPEKIDLSKYTMR